MYEAQHPSTSHTMHVPLNLTPASWPKKQKEQEKTKDPIGQAVFYPNSLPPPPRRSSRTVPTVTTALPKLIPDVVFPTPTPPRYLSTVPLPPVPASSLQFTEHNLHELGVLGFSPSGNMVRQNDEPIEYHFPPLPSSSHASPQRSIHQPQASSSSPLLAHALDHWQVYTPRSPLPLRRGSDAVGSPLSPHELPLNELIDESMVGGESSPSTRPQGLKVKIMEERRDSPHPNPFFRPSASQLSPYDNARLASPNPVPYRQAPWSASPTFRRSISSPIILPAGSPLHRPRFSPLQLHSQPFRPPTHSPLGRIPPAGFFAENYSVASGSAARPVQEDYFGPIEPLSSVQEHGAYQLGTPYLPPNHVVEPTQPPQPEELSMAEQQLEGHTLDPDFVALYELGPELGHGGFGFVCAATPRLGGKEVAVKFIFKDKLSEHESNVMEGVPIEAYVLSRCHHPGIVRFMGLFEDYRFFYIVQELHGDPWAKDAEHIPPSPVSVPIGPTSVFTASPIAYHQSPLRHQLSPMSEYASSGPGTPTRRPSMGRRASHDLFEAVENHKFTEEQARYIFRQIVDAVAYLHRMNISHRDLKDENIVIDRNFQAKIIDFGSATMEEGPQHFLMDEFRGTTSYASAEILAGQLYYAPPADIWALGILLAILLTGESPFPNTAYAREGRTRFRKPVSAGALDLMMKCFHLDPMSRANIQDLVNHPWMTRPMQRGSV